MGRQAKAALAVAAATVAVLGLGPEVGSASQPGRNGSFAVLAGTQGGRLRAILVPAGQGRARRWMITMPQYAWSPQISPDARRIAYYAGGRRPGVFVADDDGRHPRRLARYGADPVWSPDGRRLAFWQWRGAFPGESGSYQRIYVADVASGHVRRLAGTNGSTLAWSPDGRSLAFVSPRGLEWISASGGKSHLVYHPTPSRVGIDSVDWSPDGGTFLLGLVDLNADVFDVPPAGPDTLSRIGLNTIWRNGGGMRRIAAATPMSGVPPAAWSPDGRSIALICGSPGSESPAGICATDRRGNHRRRLYSLRADEEPSTLDWLALAVSPRAASARRPLPDLTVTSVSIVASHEDVGTTVKVRDVTKNTGRGSSRHTVTT
jgi:WD40 repeat protein